MGKLKGLIAVVATLLAGVSFNTLAAGSASCPELPANSGLKWVNSNLLSSPFKPDPAWCDAVDIHSNKIIFAAWFPKDTNVGQTALGGRGRPVGEGIVAGKRVAWRKQPYSAYTASMLSNPVVNPLRFEFANVSLDNGALMQVILTATNAEERQKALDAVARMRLPNQG